MKPRKQLLSFYPHKRIVSLTLNSNRLLQKISCMKSL